jgi:hypothetical protein
MALVTFRCLLWLVALDPDPFPRCVEVRHSDLTRFPPEAVCVAERRFWRERAEQIKRHIDDGLTPWGYELRRDHDLAFRLAEVWGHLEMAHYYSNWYGSPSRRHPDVLHHLERYQTAIGDGPYLIGWSPFEVTGERARMPRAK